MKNMNQMKGVLATLCAACAVLLAGSCTREPLAEGDGGRSTVSFVVGSQTRASVTPHEGEVTSLDVLVFRSGNGVLDNGARVEGAGVDRISVELTAGVALRWYVVANAPRGLLSYVSESTFLEGLTLLTHGTETSLVMLGSGSLPEGPVAESVQVALDRYACKVTVETVTVEWADAFTMASSVTLGRIALVNVVGSTPWSGTPAAGELWYNRMGVESGLPAYVADMTVKDYEGRTLQEGVAADVASPLYCMPNPVANDVNSANAPEWSPRSTRVAVEVLLDGKANWYPVDLPAMRCNTHYVIRSLVLTGPGSQGPDWPVERDDVRFSVSVEPWVNGDIVPVFQ